MPWLAPVLAGLLLAVPLSRWSGSVRLGNLLGELTAGHPVASTHERKEIYSIDSSDPEFSFSDEWHTDVTFMKEPPAISILRAVTLPDYGGDTSWADAQAAYDSLSKPFRGLVDQLVGQPAPTGADRLLEAVDPVRHAVAAPPDQPPGTLHQRGHEPLTSRSSRRRPGGTPRAAGARPPR